MGTGELMQALCSGSTSGALMRGNTPHSEAGDGSEPPEPTSLGTATRGERRPPAGDAGETQAASKPRAALRWGDPSPCAQGLVPCREAGLSSVHQLLEQTYLQTARKLFPCPRAAFSTWGTNVKL